MNVTTRAMMADLLNPAIRAIMFEEYKMWDPEYPKVFNVETTDKQEEKESTLSGLTAAPRKLEGKSLTYDAPIQGYDVTYTQLTYALGFAVTMEMQKFDLSGKIRKLPKELMKSCRQTQEVTAWNIFNRAFSGSYLGGDGVSLCSTSHPLLGGGVQDNRPSPDVDFSLSGIRQALLDFHTMTNDRGFPIVQRPKHIIIHPTKELIADEILKSSQKPYTSDNEINAIKDKGLSYMLGHWLTSTGYWWVVSDKSQHTLRYLWSMEPDVEHDTDFATKNLLWSVVMMFAVGWTNYFGVWGSAGS